MTNYFQRYIDKPITFFVTEDQIATRVSNQLTYIREAIKPNNDKSNTEIANWLTQHIFSIIKDIESHNEINPKALLK